MGITLTGLVLGRSASRLDRGAPTPSRPPGTPIERALKRALDLAVAGMLLLVMCPVLATIAIAVKISDGGPALYRWRIVGQGGRPLTSYKFRSMVVNADELKAGLEAANDVSGPTFKMRNDPRVTTIGRFLRRYSLDELPELWSVLTGDISLVGPRPSLQSEYARFSDEQRAKVVVKPGITCLWQISGRGEITDFDERLRLDFEYIEHWSLRLDMAILLRTIPAVLSGRGAW